MPASWKSLRQKPMKFQCICRCNRLVTRWTIWRHVLFSTIQHKSGSPPPCKRHRTGHFQVDASSSSSGHPQFHAPSFKFNPSLPFLDVPEASNLLQSPGYARTIPSGCVVDDILLNIYAQTHWATNESNNKDSEDTPKGDATGAADSISPGTGDLWNGEDIDMEEEEDPCGDVVSHWDILAEDFIAEAEEFGKSKDSLLHTLWLTSVFGF